LVTPNVALFPFSEREFAYSEIVKLAVGFSVGDLVQRMANGRRGQDWASRGSGIDTVGSGTWSSLA
jgi:hypothetical protein